MRSPSTPLLLANDSRWQARSGFAPYRYMVCVAHNQEGILLYAIPLEAAIEVVETNAYLVIKGTTKSLNSLCDFFAAMEQLPQTYGLQLGNWEFIVLNNYALSSLEEKK